MAKKIFARARVAKGARGWHIDFTVYDAASGTEARHRRDFGLNDIPDLQVRGLVADRLCANIDLFCNVQKPDRAHSATIKQAVKAAVDAKMKLPRAGSRSNYRTISKKLDKWLTANGLGGLDARAVTKRHAVQLWDELGAKGYSPRTMMNYRTALHAIWNEMIERELVSDNIWAKVRPPRQVEKSRRAFTADERRTVAKWAEQNDYWLFRCILLQYFCYIRPVELSRLKFRDFDLGAGSVTILGSNAKTWAKRTVTMPAAIMRYFTDGRFDRYPGNYFVLGRVPSTAGNWEIGPSTTALSIDRMYLRHRRALKRLQAAGQLGDITGLTWYSWKDTGISEHAAKATPMATRDQAGHKDLRQTMIYYHQGLVNKEYKDLDNDLF